MTGKAVVGLAGFTFLALLPSYVDFQQAPEKRVQMVGAYVVALGLIYYGVLAT